MLSVYINGEVYQLFGRWEILKIQLYETDLINSPIIVFRFEIHFNILLFFQTSINK